MAKIFMALAMIFLGAVLVAAGPGQCCLSTGKAGAGAPPCHRHHSSSSEKGPFFACRSLDKPCACKFQGAQAFLQVPTVLPGEKVPGPPAEVALPVRPASVEPASPPGAPPAVFSKRHFGVPLYLLHETFLL